jgi:shikimate kinase
MHAGRGERKQRDHSDRSHAPVSPTLPHPDDSAHVERVVLLGFMCSGKSTVGEALARRMEWPLVDFDLEIERREGRPIAVIIEEEGESYFRSLEAALTEEIEGAAGLVLAPGGGWITRPELLEMIRPGTLAVWLRISPEETVRRILRDGNARPLSDHPDPLAPVTAMLAEREPLYRLADVTVPGDGRSVQEVAFEIEQLARTRGVLRPPPPDWSG